MNNSIYIKLKENKEYLKEKYQITNIGIFGSYARGEEVPDSDIDILIEFKEAPDFFKFLTVEEYLENLLQKKIDMVRPQGLKKQIKDKILSEVIYI